MTIKLSDEVVKSINTDREAGMTVAQLVDKYKEYDVTTKSVRRLTSKTKKPESISGIVVNSVLPLAVCKIGVKPSELYSIYLEHYGVVWCDVEERNVLNMAQSQKSYIRSKVKEKAKKQGLVACFVPEWMDRNRPKESNHLMMEIANDLYELIEEKVNYYKESFPQEKDTSWSVRNELYALVVSGYDPSGVVSRCERNAEAVRVLSNS